MQREITLVKTLGKEYSQSSRKNKIVQEKAK